MGMLVCSVSSICVTPVRYKKTSSSNRQVSVPYFPAHLIINGKWKRMTFVKSSKLAAEVSTNKSLR